MATGLGFCRTCGHGDSHKLPSYYNDESHPWLSVWTDHGICARQLEEDSVDPDAIKIWSTGGGIWRWDQKLDQHYTLEEIQAVVDECRMVGIPVWSMQRATAAPGFCQGRGTSHYPRPDLK